MPKTCIRCKVTKPAEEFHVNRAAPDGRKARCKECVAASTVATHRNTDPRRGQQQWEGWELDFLAEHPDLTARQVADHLKRTTAAVRIARYRMKKRDE